MEYLRWSDELRVGVTDCDAQHQGLVALVNKLHTAMLEGEGKAILGSTIDELADYAATHFATEEQYFAAYGYPGAAEHRSQHQAFVQRVADFQRGFAEDRLMMSLEVMDFLSDWLVEHIQGSDKAYGPFLNDRGVT